jgi:hypothetical protein
VVERKQIRRTQRAAGNMSRKRFKRLLLRFEFIQQRHYGMKLMAYTLINLRHFCGA